MLKSDRSMRVLGVRSSNRVFLPKPPEEGAVVEGSWKGSQQPRRP